MEWFLSSLLVVIAVVALALIAYLFRGRAIEHRLALLDAIADLSQRLHLVEDAVHTNGTAPLERKLDLLTQRLNSIDARLAAAGAASAPLESRLRGEPASDREIVERELAAQGYGAVRVVSSEPVHDGVRELKVETSRSDVCLKGSVLVAGGAVVETRLAPIYELFP